MVNLGTGRNHDYSCPKPENPPEIFFAKSVIVSRKASILGGIIYFAQQKEWYDTHITLVPFGGDVRRPMVDCLWTMVCMAPSRTPWGGGTGTKMNLEC